MTKSKNNRGKLLPLAFVGLILVVGLFALLLRGNNVVLLNPQGFIAEEQYKLMLTSTAIMVAFAIPILFFLYYFAWKYRESNQNAKYSSNNKHSKFFTFAIWGAPTLIAIILSSIMIPATHKLEPRKLIESDKETMTIQVVALRWKWLFIYPEHDIATVNFVQIPKDTPVQFELTADETPMSSFWIPSLGGMLYAMTEHVNRLNLMGDTVGDFEGSAAEINGSGFSGMRFTTRVSSEADFNKWVEMTRQNSDDLTQFAYESLLKPSEDHPASFYSRPDPMLFSNILSKYSGSHSGSHGESKDHGSDNKHMEKMEH